MVGPGVDGPAAFSQDHNPNFGAISGQGEVAGIVFAAFTFEESGDVKSPSTFAKMDCSIDVKGQLTVDGDTMTGPFTETDSCGGVRVGQFSGTLTMRRQ